MPSDRPKVLVVFGTRPEIIKLAPVVAALRRHPAVEVVTCNTGQQRELSAQALAAFDLAADIQLDLMRRGQDLHDVVAGTLCGVRDAVARIGPALVVVQGDTGSAVGAGLAAYYARVPVAHVEAGLRTGDMFNPFPEEINRRLLDELSTLLFAPTPRARDTLLREGIPAERVHLTGNTVVDALLAAGRRPPSPAAAALTAGLPGPLLLLTCHRRENFGAGLAAIFDGVLEVARRRPDLTVLFPVHPNPEVREPAEARFAGAANVRLIGQLPYHDFLHLLGRADLMVSDSGGVQEEAPSFGTPLLVVRRLTERMEGIEAGHADMVGPDCAAIAARAMDLLEAGRRPRAPNPYGDGRAGERIAAICADAAVMS